MVESPKLLASVLYIRASILKWTPENQFSITQTRLVRYRDGKQGILSRDP